MTDAEPKVVAPERAVRWAAVVLIALAGCAFLPWLAAPGVRWSLVGSAALFGGWLLFLKARRPEALEAIIVIRRPHWVQALVHGSIFAYWGAYVDVVYPQIPLILAQVIFAYGLDLLMSWTRGRKWVVGFGPIPIIGSTNLFLWFHDGVFFLQLAMVAAAFLSREFLRWQREGRDVHIFNPSGFGLSIASVLVIATGTTEWTFGTTIATTLIQAPYMFEWIFVAGLVVQILFGVCLVTMTSALTVFLGGWLWFSLTGNWHFENTHIPVAVFLGMHLLITDPVTSPRSNGGKVLFGMLYGLAVFPLYTALLAIGVPSFYDKLLQVPVLNLMVPLLERVGRHIRVPKWRLDARLTNLVHVAIWTSAFLFMRTPLKTHPGQQPGHWEALCTVENKRACQNLVKLYDQGCARGIAVGCLRLGDLFLAGKRVPQSEARSVSYFELACQHGAPQGCAMLAVAFEEGRGGLERSSTNAGLVRERACRLGDEAACIEQAGRMLDGRGVSKNPPEAAKMLEAACGQGMQKACMVLAFMLHKGQGIPMNPARARSLYERACAAGLQPACQQRDAMGTP